MPGAPREDASDVVVRLALALFGLVVVADVVDLARAIHEVVPLVIAPGRVVQLFGVLAVGVAVVRILFAPQRLRRIAGIFDGEGLRPALQHPPNAGGGSHGLGIIRGGWPERGSRAATPGGMTALLYAARDGRVELARTLLDAGANVNRAEANEISPLLMALTNDHMAVARLLIERGADINAADFWGRTPLFSAVEIRNRDYTRGNEHGIDREAALDLITLLIDRGANPNSRTKEIPPIRRWVTSLGDLTWINMIGQTAFIRAAMSGDITTMRLLLAHGADPKITTVGGTTALVTAAGGNVAVQQSFVESRESSMAAVKLCLELGIDVNAANETGFTAVMGAANKGWDDVLEVLLKAGGRLDVQDAQGRTPLRWAKGEFIALHPPEEKPTTIALIEKYARERGSAGGTR